MKLLFFVAGAHDKRSRVVYLARLSSLLLYLRARPDNLTQRTFLVPHFEGSTLAVTTINRLG
jgi:hypothetical protein